MKRYVPVDEVLAEFIKMELMKRKITITKFAEALGTTPSYVSNYLNRTLRDGKPRGVTFNTANDMLHVLGKSWHHYNRFLKEKARRIHQ